MSIKLNLHQLYNNKTILMRKALKYSFLLLTFSVFAVGCGDDSCDVLEETIVGTWESAPLGEGEFQFLSDGSLVDDNDLLIEAEFNGSPLNDKTWRVENDNKLFVRASDGSQFLEAELNVPTFDCDVITVEQLGISIEFSRK